METVFRVCSTVCLQQNQALKLLFLIPQTPVCFLSVVSWMKINSWFALSRGLLVLSMTNVSSAKPEITL